MPYLRASLIAHKKTRNFEGRRLPVTSREKEIAEADRKWIYLDDISTDAEIARLGLWSRLILRLNAPTLGRLYIIL